MAEEFRSHVAGEWVASVSGRLFDDTNPADRNDAIGGFPQSNAEDASGFFYTPTIFADVVPGMRIAQEEIFGPTTAIMPVDSMEQAQEHANSTEYGLSLSIYTRDVNRAFRAMRELEAGIVYVNAPTIGAEIQVPFRGHQEHGQRPSRGRHRRPGRVHRMEDHLRGLLRPPAEGADDRRRVAEPQAAAASVVAGS